MNMKKYLLGVVGLFFISTISAQEPNTADLQKAASSPEVQKEFDKPDGAAIFLKPDGSFQILARGTATYDFNDADDINDARKEATLKAKAALAKFMKEKCTTEESLSEQTKKVKTVTSDGETQTASISKESIKNSATMIRNSADALLKGVITIKEQKIPRKGSSGEIQVTVGISSKTLKAVGTLTTGIANAVQKTESVHNSSSPTAQHDNSNLPKGWIKCIGNGSDRQSAVSAALTEGIQQVYGLSLKNDSRIRERVKKIKINAKVSRNSTKAMEENTLTQTAGFVKEYRIIFVKKLEDGTCEATIHALIVNPRGGGITAVLLCRPEMSLEDLTKIYDLGPKRRLSGANIARIVGKTFNQAFAQKNKFYVLDAEDLDNVIKQQNLSVSLVQSGLAPTQELVKAGQLLTADYILTSSVEELKYSRKIGMNKKTQKFGPVYKMSIRLKYKLTNAITGQSVLSGTESAVLENDEISTLLAEDEETDLLLALMEKLTGSLNNKIPSKQ